MAKRLSLSRNAIIPLILIGVASFHLLGFYRHQRSSWGAGAGFGMFATSDSHGTRWIVLHAADGTRRVLKWTTADCPPEVTKALAIPSRSRVNAAASQLGGEVVVYGVRFDPESMQLRSYEISRSDGVKES